MEYNPNFKDPTRTKVSLAVVTFTDGTHADLLERCKASVAADLPEGAVHYVIPTRGLAYYAHQRQEALSLGDYVCFVDDDDTVINGSITKCFEAIKATNAGVAFTDEVLVDESGKVLSTRTGTRTYDNTARQANSVHHLAMITTSAIKEDLTQLYGRVQGVDWWILKAAIKTLGAVHVPILGYNWTQRPESLGNTMQQVKLPELKFSQTGPIPTYGAK